jgi:hypothetical protein
MPFHGAATGYLTLDFFTEEHPVLCRLAINPFSCPQIISFFASNDFERESIAPIICQNNRYQRGIPVGPHMPDKRQASCQSDSRKQSSDKTRQSQKKAEDTCQK